MTDPYAAPSGTEPLPPQSGVPVYAPPPPPPPYGAPAPPPYGAPVPTGAKNGLGVTALVLGILAIVFCWTAVGGLIFGGLAVVFGIIGRRRSGRREATNGGVALAGGIVGGIGLVLGAGFLFLWISLFNSAAFQRFLDCTRAATNDRVATDQCNRDFARDYFGQ